MTLRDSLVNYINSQLPVPSIVRGGWRAQGNWGEQGQPSVSSCRSVLTILTALHWRSCG